MTVSDHRKLNTYRRYLKRRSTFEDGGLTVMKGRAIGHLTSHDFRPSCMSMREYLSWKIGLEFKYELALADENRVAPQE